jgi:hypothetical protein
MAAKALTAKFIESVRRVIYKVRRKHRLVSFDQDHSHAASRKSHASPDRSEHITADSARGSLIGGRRQGLVILITMLVLTFVGVGIVMFWNR